jgi:hypothetical protein
VGHLHLVVKEATTDQAVGLGRLLLAIVVLAGELSPSVADQLVAELRGKGDLSDLGERDHLTSVPTNRWSAPVRPSPAHLRP